MAVAVDGPQSLVIYGINLNCYTICCDLKIKSELLLYLLSHLLGLAVADAQSAWLVVRAVGARHQLSEGSRPGEPSLKVKFFCCCIVELTLINTNLLLITYSFFYYRVSQQQTQKFKRVATAVPTCMSTRFFSHSHPDKHAQSADLFTSCKYLEYFNQQKKCNLRPKSVICGEHPSGII